MDLGAITKQGSFSNQISYLEIDSAPFEISYLAIYYSRCKELIPKDSLIKYGLALRLNDYYSMLTLILLLRTGYYN